MFKPLRAALCAAPNMASLLIVAAVLAGCAGGAQNAGVAATVTAAVLPADQVAALKATCNAAAPILAVATAPAAPAPVSSTAVYPAAYCQQLAAAPSGQVPATTDSGTPSWLPGALSAVQTAAQIAGMVLPLLL